MPAVGDTLGGRYRLLRVLGEGGMGQVFEARNENTGRGVANKTLHARAVGDAALEQRFLREAKAGAAVVHPNVVDVLDLDVDAATGLPFIVQEMLDGESLDARLDGAPGYRLPLREALQIVVPLMGAMVEAHRRGVVHRDLKPANVILARVAGGGVVPKIIDFGVARVMDARPDAALRTQDGASVGTPSYMSPEQAVGVGEVDARADVWSLGVVLYELLAGCLPYEAPSPNAMIAKILYEEPAPLRVRLPDVPADLAAIVDGALVRDRDGRWPSMEAFRDAVVASPSWSALGLAGWYATQGAPTHAAAHREYVVAAPAERSRGARGPSSNVAWSLPAKASLAPRRRPFGASVGAVALVLVAVSALVSHRLSAARQGAVVAPAAMPHIVAAAAPVVAPAIARPAPAPVVTTSVTAMPDEAPAGRHPRRHRARHGAHSTHHGPRHHVERRRTR